MKRKINRVGTSTLTVSLPSKWAQKHGMKAGDEIEVQEAEGNLIIGSKEHYAGKKEIEFNLDNIKGFMLRLLCGPYLKGYTSIKFTYSNPKFYQDIQKGLKYIIGFEIVEQRENFVKLEEISTGTEEKFVNIMLRLFHILKSFLKDIHNFLMKPYENTQGLLDIELTCDRLALYCRRLLNRNLVQGRPAENSGIYHVVCLIEQASDELRHIVEYFMNKKIERYSYDKKLTLIFDQLDEAIDITVKKFSNYIGERNYNAQLLYAKEQKKIREAIKANPDYFLDLTKENAFVYWRLANINEDIQHMSEELF